MGRLLRSLGAAALLAWVLAGGARAQDVLPVPPLAGSRVIDQTGTHRISPTGDETLPVACWHRLR